MATYFGADKNVPIINSHCESFQSPPLSVGDRVYWLGKEVPEPGSVRWLGVLPNVCKDGWSAGIQLDNPAGDIDGHWGGKELFKCQAYHGIVIDVKGLIKEADFLGKESKEMKSTLQKVAVDKEKDDTLNIKSMSSPSTSTTTTNDRLNTINSVASTSRSSEVDEVLGGIITTHSTPASCMGSFDRRVYARMFAECEVEKWYEYTHSPINGCGGNGPFDTEVIIESKNERKLKKTNTIDGGELVHVSKKERGGIFKFFRWLSGRSSSRKARGKHRRDHQVSNLRRGARTKSLESVTSLSRSFHYIPVGVLHSENGETNSDFDTAPESITCSRHGINEIKFKTASLSRSIADEREKGRRHVPVGSDVIRRFSSNNNSSAENLPGSSNVNRKKRKAPLPPTKNSRQRWIKVLPSEIEHSKPNQISRNSESNLVGKIISASPQKNKRPAPQPPSPLPILKQVENSSIEVVAEEKHGSDLSSDDNTNLKEMRAKVSAEDGTQKTSLSIKIEDENKVDKIIIENKENISDLMDSEAKTIILPENNSGTSISDEVEIKVGTSSENMVNKNFPKESKTKIDTLLSTEKQTEISIKHGVTAKITSLSPPVAIKNKEETLILESINATKEESKNKIRDKNQTDIATENKAEAATKENPLAATSEKSTLEKDEKAEDKLKLVSKLNTQMNLQALQELVESLVLQYCGNNLKLDDSKPVEKKVVDEDFKKPYQNISSKADEKVLYSHDENEELIINVIEKRILKNQNNLNFEIATEKDERPKIKDKKEINCYEDDSSLYEPIGDFLRKQRRQSVDESVSHARIIMMNGKPPSGRRRMSSASNVMTDEELEKVCKGTAEDTNEEDNSSGDPFTFWRDLDAKESHGGSKRESRLIRRLSVNGQRQSMSASEQNGEQDESPVEYPIAYTNYGYSSVYNQFNWPQNLPRNSQCISMNNTLLFPYSNHYSAYMQPMCNSNYHMAFPVNYEPNALDTQFNNYNSAAKQSKTKMYHNKLQRNGIHSDSTRGNSSAKGTSKQADDEKGKRIYANAENEESVNDTNIIAISFPPPPPPPPPRTSCCSARLAANCYWLKESGKTVEEKIQAARIEGSPTISKKNESNPKYKNPKLNSASSPATNRSCRWSLATLDNSVVIGGVRVKTPLNLWPLEYELIVPELKRLKARLEGRPLPEDEIALADPEAAAVNKLLNDLELAICGGNLEEAANRARDLAQLKIQCCVTRNEKRLTNGEVALPNRSSINPIIVNMFVEDKLSHFGPIPIRVVPSMTIGQLKLKMFKEFEFPVYVQRWILGQRLALDDNVSLSSFGVITDGFPVYLYLLTIGVDELIERRKRNSILNTNDLSKSGRATNDKTKSASKSKREKKTSSVRTRATGSSQSSINEKISNSQPNTGWTCEKCTLINAPTQSGCIMCGSARPPDYIPPDSQPEKTRSLEKVVEEKPILLNPEEEELRRLNNWQQYLNLDDQDVIHNVEVFECGICLLEVAAGDGVQLRDCLHSFCMECLRNVVSHNEEATVQCPYRDQQYSCDSILQEREIRALVPPDVFERYLRRSIATAESQAPNSFHCKTPDCPGWCLYADNANEFQCPNCGKVNCITCRVIHENINCKQYQDELAMRARTDDDAKKTQDAIEDMVKKGEAMRCPSCEVIVMKKWGCDWIVCSICKVEICWVTKGPRWGPKGRGDLTGGCKCGEKGVRCHPKCNYCH